MATIVETLLSPGGAGYVGNVIFKPDPSFKATAGGGITGQSVTAAVSNGLLDVDLAYGIYLVYMADTTPFRIFVPEGSGTYYLKHLLTGGANFLSAPGGTGSTANFTVSESEPPQTPADPNSYGQHVNRLTKQMWWWDVQGVAWVEFLGEAG
jgi:hypothetical protein